MRAALLLLLTACQRPVVDEPFRGEAYPPIASPPLPSGDFAVVPSSGSDRLSVVDLASSRIVASVPLGRRPVLLDGPHQIAGGNGLYYALDAYPAELETAGNHSHGSSKRDGWVQGISQTTLLQVSEVRVDPNPGVRASANHCKICAATARSATGIVVDTSAS